MIKNILAVVGGIYLLLTVVFIGLIIFKPYGVDVVKIVPPALQGNLQNSSNNSSLTLQQELLLRAIGVDPAKVQLTPELKQCAIPIVGEARVNEIIAGSTPSIDELMKLKVCVK